MFPYIRKRDQPREEVCSPGLIEVIRTQPRLWDAVGIRHRGQAALPHWVTRPEATRVGSLREFRERGHSVPFQVTSDKGTAPRERLELHQEDLGWRPGKGLGHSPKLPELQERLENALKDRVGLSGGDFHGANPQQGHDVGARRRSGSSLPHPHLVWPRAVLPGDNFEFPQQDGDEPSSGHTRSDRAGAAPRTLVTSCRRHG